MRSFIILSALLIAHVFAFAQQPYADTTELLPVEVRAVRAAGKNPFAKTTLSKQEIEQKNVGQDLPFILQSTPSVIVNSDAGNGVGYTGIRIRGTDATRINVTLNGIPYNDAESQGTFFVDLPDIASSANSIQVQRGVGTSSTGAGSFGGSINLSTNQIEREKSFEFNNSFGAFSTFKNTAIFHSGIFKKHFFADARLSQIRTQGYIDRAAVRLGSIFSSFGYTDEKNTLRLNVFSGKERTYQAWDGVNETALDTNRRYNSAGTEKPGLPYNNQIDHYIQTHYQLFYDRKLNAFWKTNIAFFLTRGKGYYEQYKADESLSDYGLPDYISAGDTISSTDLVRRLWLDNYFYGTVFSAQYDKAKTQFIFGGGYNRYKGDHYGNVIQSIIKNAVPQNYEWYRNDAGKGDFSVFGKWTQTLGDLQSFVDLQVRTIDYRVSGFRNNPGLTVNENYSFLNPKVGLTYSKNYLKAYTSYARASHEPNRDDFEVSSQQKPKAEKLNDVEAGIEIKKQRFSLGANLYLMSYRDQLVLTGKINDVGAYTRTNIPESYRRGVEITGGLQINKFISADANISFSKNKIKDFTEFIDDYDTGDQRMNLYAKTDIAFSPNTVGSYNLIVSPIKNLAVTFSGKYAGKQFLDNTSNAGRELDAWYTQDLRASYSFTGKQLKKAEFFIQFNNVFSEKYEPSGYTFSYYYNNKLSTENYFFPMAEFNFFAGINLKF